ncbi:lipid A export permease/ATP-binding protein MsbA [soil metagenome]
MQKPAFETCVAPTDNRRSMTTPQPKFLARLRRIAPYFGDSRLGFAVAIGMMVISAATEPLIPALMKPLLDDGFQGGGIPLWLVPVALIGLFGLRGLTGFLAQYALSWSANRGVVEMRKAMFDRLLTAEPTMFTRHTASALTNTLVYEVQSGAMQLIHSMLSLARDSLTLVALLGYLLWLNWKLTLFVAVLFPAVAIVMKVLSGRLHRLTVESQAATDKLAYVVEENVLAWRIVRLHGAGDHQRGRFSGDSKGLSRLSLKATIAASTMTPITQVLAACALSAVIVVALWQSGTEGRSVGGFVSFVTAMLMLIAPIKHLSEAANPITRGLAALERGVALIHSSAAESGGSFDPGRSAGHLELRGVTVRYREDQAPALCGIDMEMKAGEAVALVGPSGAGKSTLVNLLPRFLEPSSGAILLDGVPLAEWNVEALRRQFALVSQDVVLFNDTVAANVGLGDDLDRERVREALRGANLLTFVETLPQGIDTVIGHNGGEFSGGQRQRLAIARAIYKDAPILILDEATSALDSESERLVQQALDTLMQGRTSLVIAHRLSTVERADRIVVIDGGKVVEQGPHATLLAQRGLYARLHSLQFSA